MNGFDSYRNEFSLLVAGLGREAFEQRDLDRVAVAIWAERCGTTAFVRAIGDFDGTPLRAFTWGRLVCARLAAADADLARADVLILEALVRERLPDKTTR